MSEDIYSFFLHPLPPPSTAVVPLVLTNSNRFGKTDSPPSPQQSDRVVATEPKQLFTPTANKYRPHNLPIRPPTGSEPRYRQPLSTPGHNSDRVRRQGRALQQERNTEPNWKALLLTVAISFVISCIVFRYFFTSSQKELEWKMQQEMHSQLQRSHELLEEKVR